MFFSVYVFETPNKAKFIIYDVQEIIIFTIVNDSQIINLPLSIDKPQNILIILGLKINIDKSNSPPRPH